ncbi:MAG TPA: molybdopterin-binding protein [Micropepsaceae bacterium]|nr:molybdopterin-binding protein [Micropepsaceae bacterium]
MNPSVTITAAVLVIGDEILSGRTQDVNVAAIARFLAPYGIDLAEVRFVPDIQAEIVAAVNALRGRYTYVFTTGGIGPTHDDITADAIGAAFDLPVEHHPEAMALLAARYQPGEFNEMRQRMARMPVGASLIKNPVSAAPGFQIENVFVMAGVPKIMQAMLEDVGPRLQQGATVISRSLTVRLPEGKIAQELAEIQAAHPAISIGSYPFFASNSPAGGAISSGTTLVVRGRDGAEVEAAARAVEALARSHGAEAENSRG